MTEEELDILFQQGIPRHELISDIRTARKLVGLMKRASFTTKEINNIIGNYSVRIGKKEKILYQALLDGTVNCKMSYEEMAKRLKPQMDLTRQSWALAFNKLVDAKLVV